VRLLYIGPFNLLTGYGQAARGYARALKKLGVDLRLAISNDKPAIPEIADFWAPPLVGNCDGVTHVLVHAPPSTLAALRVHFAPLVPTATRWAAMTTWETFPLPDHLAEVLDAFSVTVVPSRVCKDQMSLVCESVSVVPHILETDGPEAWPLASPTPVRRPRSEAPFTFLWHGDWSERKNPIGVLKAYWHTFAADDDVRLVMKTSSYDKLTLRSLIDRAGTSGLPAVEIVTDHLSQDALVSLYRQSDAFITLSRGDAWGFPAFHAASQGLPVIYTQNVGHDAFLAHSAASAPVASHPTPVCSAQTFIAEAVGGGLRMTVSEPEGVAINQTWAEPRLDRACAEMERFYRYGAEARKVDFLPRFSSEVVGKQLLSALEEM